MRLALSRSVVVVTGGARGIGAATASAFSALGASVYVGDLDGPRVLDVTSRTSYSVFVDPCSARRGGSTYW